MPLAKGSWLSCSSVVRMTNLHLSPTFAFAEVGAINMALLK